MRGSELPVAEDAAGPEETAIVLAGVLDVSTASQLRERLSEALDAGLSVAIDAAAIERIDTACLQVLIAFARSARSRGLGVRWRNPSESLHDSADLLDVSRLLDLPVAAMNVEN